MHAGPGFRFEPVDPSTLSRAALAERVRELDRMRSQLDHEFRCAVGVFDREGVHHDDGAANAGSWLAARCTSLTGRAVRSEVHIARKLRDMPVTRAAAEAGELGSAKVRSLAGAFDPDDPAVVAAFERDEELLVREARQLSADATGRLCRSWRALADDTSEARRHDRQRATRRLSISQTFGGAWRIDGFLDAESGAVVAAALTGVAERLFRSDQATAEAEGGPVDGIVVAGRTATQRRADALVELCRLEPEAAAGADGGDTYRPIPASVVVTIDALALHRRAPGIAEVEGTPSCTLSVEAARRLACDARISRIVTGPASEPLDVGRATRSVPPALRRAVNLRDGGCTFPGCDRPPGWCHAHHIRHWASGGTTDPPNLTLLCSHHHHAVHEGGYTVNRSDDGTLHFTRPDGTPLRMVPNP